MDPASAAGGGGGGGGGSIIIIVVVIAVMVMIVGLMFVIARRRKNQPPPPSSSVTAAKARPQNSLQVNPVYAPQWNAAAKKAQEEYEMPVASDARPAAPDNSYEVPVPNAYVETTPGSKSQRKNKPQTLVLDSAMYVAPSSGGNTSPRLSDQAFGFYADPTDTDGIRKCGYTSSAGRQCKKFTPLIYCPVHLCPVCRQNSKSSQAKACDGCAGGSGAPEATYSATAPEPSYEVPVASNPDYGVTPETEDGFTC